MNKYKTNNLEKLILKELALYKEEQQLLNEVTFLEKWFKSPLYKAFGRFIGGGKSAQKKIEKVLNADKRLDNIPSIRKYNRSGTGNPDGPIEFRKDFATLIRIVSGNSKFIEARTKRDNTIAEILRLQAKMKDEANKIFRFDGKFTSEQAKNQIESLTNEYFNLLNKLSIDSDNLKKVIDEIRPEAIRQGPGLSVAYNNNKKAFENAFVFYNDNALANEALNTVKRYGNITGGNFVPSNEYQMFRLFLNTADDNVVSALEKRELARFFLSKNPFNQINRIKNKNIQKLLRLYVGVPPTSVRAASSAFRFWKTGTIKLYMKKVDGKWTLRNSGVGFGLALGVAGFMVSGRKPGESPDSDRLSVLSGPGQLVDFSEEINDALAVGDTGKATAYELAEMAFRLVTNAAVPYASGFFLGSKARQFLDSFIKAPIENVDEGIKVIKDTSFIQAKTTLTYSKAVLSGEQFSENEICESIKAIVEGAYTLANRGDGDARDHIAKVRDAYIEGVEIGHQSLNQNSLNKFIIDYHKEKAKMLYNKGKTNQLLRRQLKALFGQEIGTTELQRKQITKNLDKQAVKMLLQQNMEEGDFRSAKFQKIINEKSSLYARKVAVLVARNNYNKNLSSGEKRISYLDLAAAGILTFGAGGDLSRRQIYDDGATEQQLASVGQNTDRYLKYIKDKLGTKTAKIIDTISMDNSVITIERKQQAGNASNEEINNLSSYKAKKADIMANSVESALDSPEAKIALARATAPMTPNQAKAILANDFFAQIFEKRETVRRDMLNKISDCFKKAMPAS